MLKTETSFRRDFGKCWKRKREQKEVFSNVTKQRFESKNDVSSHPCRRIGRGSSTSHSWGAPRPLCSAGKHSTKVNGAFGPARSFSNVNPRGRQLKPRLYSSKSYRTVVQKKITWRIVENKDCWNQGCLEQGLLNPGLLKTRIVESMIVKIHAYWIRGVLNARCVE